MTYTDFDSLNLDKQLLTASTTTVSKTTNDVRYSLNGDKQRLIASKNTVEPYVIGLDWERDGWRVSRNGAPAVRMSREDFLTAPFTEADVIVVEQPHMRERNVYSVAQVYTIEELRQLKSAAKFKLFPAKLTYKASREAGHTMPGTDDPDKLRDAETIALYAKAHPEILQTWKRYTLPENDKTRKYWPPRDALRDDLREALNELRAAWNHKPVAEKYELPEVKALCTLLADNFDSIPESAKKAYGIKNSRNGIRVERMPVVLTLYLACYDREGNLRIAPNGKPIGNSFILNAIGMSHSHKPNLARSQLTHHGMRYYVKGGGTRTDFMRIMRNFLTYLKTCDSLNTDKQLLTASTYTVSTPDGDLFKEDKQLLTASKNTKGTIQNFEVEAA